MNETHRVPRLKPVGLTQRPYPLPRRRLSIVGTRSTPSSADIAKQPSPPQIPRPRPSARPGWDEHSARVSAFASRPDQSGRDIDVEVGDQAGGQLGQRDSGHGGIVGAECRAVG